MARRLAFWISVLRHCQGDATLSRALDEPSAKLWLDFGGAECRRRDGEVPGVSFLLPAPLCRGCVSRALSVVPVHLQLSPLGSKQLSALRHSDTSFCSTRIRSLDPERPARALGNRSRILSARGLLGARNQQRCPSAAK